MDYLNLQFYEEAKTHFTTFKEYIDQYELLQFELYYFQNMGRLYFETDTQPDLAIEYNEIALEQAIANRNYLAAGDISNMLGGLHLKLKNFTVSLKYLKEALSFADSVASPDFLDETYQYLADYHASMKNFEQALFYQKAYKELADSIFTAENNALIAEYETEYETLKKERQIEILEREAEIQQLTNLNQLIVIVRNKCITTVSDHLFYCTGTTF